MMDVRNGHTTDHRYIERRKIRRCSFTWIFYFACFLSVIKSVDAGIPYRNCEPEKGKFSACFPSPEKIRKNAINSISVDPPKSTCGLDTDEYYLPLGMAASPKTCKKGSQTKENIFDQTMSTWWQSKTWTVADFAKSIPKPQYPITLRLSFDKKYRLSQNISLTFNSGRPQRMVIEKSNDYGKTWSTLQYYARNCARDFPKVPTSYATNLSAVICTQSYSRESGSPKPGGIVHFPGSGERMKDYKLQQYFQELDKAEMTQFFTFTDIRIRLIYPATDSKENSMTEFDFLSYYYAISEIDIVGSCFCNLHGSGCKQNTQNPKQIECVCSHNTMGKDCEKCKPLFNNKPWRMGSFLPSRQGSANACEECNCNGHAKSCTYDAGRKQGVCNNCEHNTFGVMCEMCLANFYRNMKVILTDNATCLPCNCEVQGLLNVTNTLCSKETGQCPCKPTVTGRRCDRCKDTFYGLLLPASPGTCTECSCNQLGTINGSLVCNTTTGQCPCKASITGRACDKCKDGFYKYPLSSNMECSSCECSPGGSNSLNCDNFGICPCIPKLAGIKCTMAATNYYLPALDEFILQPASGTCSIDSDLNTAKSPFDGKVFATCSTKVENSVVFEPIIRVQEQYELIWSYYPVVRYSLLAPNVTAGASLTILASSCPSSSTPLPNLSLNFTTGQSTAWMSTTSVILDRRCRYTVTLTIPIVINVTTTVLVDSAVFLPAMEYGGKNMKTKTSPLGSSYIKCAKQFASLMTRSSAMSSSTCRPVLWSVAAEVNKEGKACQCNLLGTVGQCKSVYGGQCECKPGVAGSRCDSCLPGYYNLTTTGCAKCPTKTCTEVLASPITNAERSGATESKLNTTERSSAIDETSSTACHNTIAVMSTVSPNYSGIIIGVGLVICVIIVIFTVLFLHHKNKIQLSCLKGKVETYDGGRISLPTSSGGNFGEHDIRNSSKNQNNITWLSTDNADPKTPHTRNGTFVLIDGHDLPVFYFGHPESTASTNNTGEKIDNDVVPTKVAAKTKLKDLANAATIAGFMKESKLSGLNRVPTDYIPPPPSFRTFKSDDPFALPVMTVSESSPPRKPKRQKKCLSVKPLNADFGHENNNNLVYDSNKSKDSVKDDKTHEIFIKSDKTFADLDSFDEVNGSLV